MATASLYPADPAGQKRRQQQVQDNFVRRFQATATRFSKELATWRPGTAVQAVKHVAASEICEYGSQPANAELRRPFPFFK